MKKYLILLLLSLTLVGCNTDIEPEVDTEADFNTIRIAHKACLDNGYYFYDGECVDWEDVPMEDREDLMREIAEIIAVVNDVTFEEAVEMLEEATLE